MSLGILRVAAVLEQAGQAVEMLDLSGIENYEMAAAAHAARSRAEVFGLTATTPQLPAAVKLAAVLRRARPSCRLILGGPHVTLVHAALKREQKLGQVNGRAHRAYVMLARLFDTLVAGDGENAVFTALQPDPPKVIDGDNPQTPLFLTSQHLNELPFPARHLVDMESYRYFIGGNDGETAERATHLVAQLGCCFGCHFCGGRESPSFRRVRLRSTANVIAEIAHLHDTYGYRGFNFFDDELNVNPQMIELMKAIAALGKARGVQWKLRGFIKSQLFTDQQAEAMYAAGFRVILVGFESGSERILANINKQATRAENTRCMEIARRHGLKVKALMSIGHAGETAETIRVTRDWLLEVKPADFDVTVITPYPGSPYYDWAVEEQPGVWTFTAPKSGDKLYSIEVDYTVVADYYKGVMGQYQSHVFTDALTPAEIVQARDQMEQEVREQLKLPFNPAAAAQRYEHSMGQLPPHILRATAAR